MGSQTRASNSTFRFRSVVFITCGLEAEELVSVSKLPHHETTADCRALQLGTVTLASKTPLPNNHAIQVAVRDGLGITSANERQLFELDRNGTLPDMNSFLCSQMPKLFNHFAKTKPWILTIDQSNWVDGDRVWPYVLLARANRNLVPAVLNGHVDPTVSDFRDNSGRASCPDGERIVFLGEGDFAGIKQPVYATADQPPKQQQLTILARRPWRNGQGHQSLVG